MIRILFGAGTAAAANGITADVDVLLDAGAAGSSGDDFTINLVLNEGAGTGDVFSAGLDKSVALSVSGGDVTASAALDGCDETITTTLNTGGVFIAGFTSTISVALVAGEADGGAIPEFSHDFTGFSTASFSQRLGFVFTVGSSNLTCIGLGLFQTTAASENVRIHRVSDGALIAEANIATTSNWNDVSISPVTLVASTQYVISARAGGATRTVPRNHSGLVFTTAISGIAYRFGTDDNQPTGVPVNSYAFARFEFTQ
jgi:hypothetical protein